MNLPKAKLDRDTSLKLWCDTHSEYAKEQVVLGNLGLIGMVLKQLNQNPQDEDLFSIGIIGLLKALNTYDTEKGFEFSSYSALVIRNEILMSFRKNMVSVAFSLDEPYLLDNGDSLNYGEMIACNTNFEEETLSLCDIQDSFNGLSERDRRIIGLRVQGKRQGEIAGELGLSQSYVSRIIKGVRAQICT